MHMLRISGLLLITTKPVSSVWFVMKSRDKVFWEVKLLLNQSSDILQHSQNRPTGDRWLKF